MMVLVTFLLQGVTMEYIGNISYGKDSLAMLEVIKQNNMPLDRLIHAEIMATPTIPADLPEMMEFKEKADKIIKKRYGLKVEHIHAKNSYEEYFYKKRGKRAKPENVGKMYGFPIMGGNWCNAILKMSVLNKFNKKNIIQYVGIAIDEPKRFKILNERKISPLKKFNITEQQCYDWCEEHDLLSPIYKIATRGGCWFCHNQSMGQLKNLRKQFPEYWKLMLKWDSDSPVSFRTDGTTLHDLDERFRYKDMQINLFD